ncbi:FAR1-related sequence 5-like protein [Tanacetum coccineum]
MNQLEKMFVVKAATNKIGATRAHNLLCSMKGGYEYVHGTTDDFKNHQRDVNVFIGESDAQMLINKMENRKMYVPNFTFQYRVENSELVAMFWADEVAKCNYKEFGDIVSFDATFNNNNDSSGISCDSSGIPLNLLRFHFNLMRFHLNLMYNMKFVPFIGIDNHGKCVTLGSGMLLHEDTKSYTWLLNAFMTAFSHEPTMIVTDQDGAMKRAIEAVFKKAKHRLCMWHIMQKIPSKICREIYDETNFKERFDKIIWNMFIEPLKFEEKWSELIKDFGLQSHKWLTKMFNLREIWISAYFIDSPLYGLMRTTSRSESEKSFFKSFTIPGATLVSFMMSYESAMERQRYRQEALDFKTIEAAPKCETKLAIELHAAHVYTRTIFLLVQTEINEDFHGISCDSVESHEIGIESHEISMESHVILWNLIKDEGKMGAYVEKLKILLDEVKADMRNPPSRNIGDVIGGIFSITKPNQIAVQNPTKAVNKGEYLKKGERLKNEKEKALKVGKKKLWVFRHVIHYGSHLIHSESHEIHSESNDIHSESHEIHSESHEIQSESHEI